jgi:hypothetical protein
MDIISHGLWGGLAFGRKNKIQYLWGVFFGVMPDLFSFGIFTIASFLGLVQRPEWGNGVPHPDTIPGFVHILYDLTHSLIMFSLVFILVWLIRRKPFVPLLAWVLHIAIDIPTHSIQFFPTPFLEPISDYVFDGISWGTPIVFFSNLGLLFIGYAIWFIAKRFKK